MKRLLLLITICISSVSFGQVPVIEWQRSLGGTNWDYARSIQQTTDGGYIVAGYTESNDGDVTGNHGGYDCWIVKLDPSGDTTWQKPLGGSGADYAFSIQQTTDGGYIVAGYSGSNDGDVTGNNGSFDYWIVKLDSSGNITWQKSLGGSGVDQAFSIQQTTDGGYIVGGSSQSNDGDVTGNHGDDDYWIVKLDPSGNITWQKSLGGMNEDIVSSIQQTTDGGYIVAGYSQSNDGDVTGNHGGLDYWIVKLDPSGNIIWQKSLGGTSLDNTNSIQQTMDGGYIIAGYSGSNDGDVTGNHGGYDCWIVKLDNTGNIEWQKSLGGTVTDYGRSIQQTSDGGYIVGGYSQSNDGDVTGNHGGFDYWIVKLDNTGNITWQKSLGGSTADFAFSIQQTTDGDYVVAGYSQSGDGDVTGNNGSYDYWIVKLNSCSNSSTDTQSACGSFTWIDGNTYTTSNNSATWLLTNTSGCDSTITLDLTITNSNTGTDVQTACGSYTWIDGITYTDSNNSATWVLTNAGGCDSTVTLDLTITNSNTGTDVQVACDSYTWIDGNTYTTNNNSATFVLTNAGGCDSTVTLDLTINESPVIQIKEFDVSACGLTDGSIEVTGLNESTDYEVTVGANTLFITSDISGELIIPNLAPGTYDVSCLDVLSGCSSNTEIGIINDLWGLPNAGTNTLIDTCFYGPIDFLDLLGGTPDSGGIWIPALNSGTYIFDPLIDPSGNYTYSVSNNCGTSTSTIGITVTGICAGISGNVYNDISEDCTIDMNEPGIEDITIQINPGSYVVQTDSLGNWILPPLAAGTYTATIDSTNLNWSPTCPVSQTFTVTDPNTLTYAPDFGMVNNNQCSAPDISIYAPFMRRCFINQIYVQACNDEIASGVLPNAYVDIELDPHLILNSAITNQNFGSGTETYIDVTTDFWGYENYWELVPTGNPCGTGTIYSGGNPAVGCNGGGLKNQAPGGYPSNTTISEGPIYLTFGDQYDLRTVDDWGDGGTCYSLNGQTYCEGPNLSYGLLTFTALNGNINYTDLGNNVYRFDVGDLDPGECVNFTLNATLSCDAILDETICMNATLYPIESCTLDTIPTPPLPPTFGNDPNLVMPQECTLPWDNSSLQVDGWCQGDSVHFSITNTGDFGGGDMDCYSPVFLYINDTLVLIDSVQIQGQETVYFSYPAFGQTFILNAEQHPLHPGNSHPNAHVELCGSDSTQWIPDLVNNQPLDDADPVVDIYCGVVTGSYDPNDKTGYPLGVTDENFIHPNRQLQYVVRFQNTGTDTAFTVVIRDTLDTDLNIFTVNSGASSHEYTFQMKGQRILEWTFNNILLPDSTTNEPESNGFVTFTVDQVPNLPEGTLITNQADIYFDLNEPIITNETEHRISYFTESNPLELTEVIAGDNHFTIYPNPNNGLLFIEMDDYSSSVDYTIFDFNGRPVLSGKLNQQKNAVYMQDLNPGAYVIQIDGSRPVRIIKK